MCFFFGYFQMRSVDYWFRMKAHIKKDVKLLNQSTHEEANIMKKVSVYFK